MIQGLAKATISYGSLLKDVINGRASEAGGVLYAFWSKTNGAEER